jgi:hypothetical protein
MPQTRANTVVQSRNLSFMTLPGEVRNLIYGFVLSRKMHFYVRSPLPRHELIKRRKNNQTSRLVGLLGLNKQIQSEVSILFYSKANFHFGNGEYHSTEMVNMHGLSSFLTRVPKHLIACITNITLNVHLTIDNYEGRSGIRYAKLDDSIDAADFQRMATVAKTKFLALQRLTIQYQSGGRGCREGRGARCDYRKSQTMGITLSILLLHPTLKEIMVQREYWAYMDEAIDYALRNQVVDEGDTTWELKPYTSSSRLYATLAR